MTWSLKATLPFNSDQEKIDAIGSLLDTHVNALPNYTVTAHPAPSASKRSMVITAPVNAADGNPYSIYLWWAWNFQTVNMYEDATYSLSLIHISEPTRPY